MTQPFLFLHVDVDNLWVGEHAWGLAPCGQYDMIYEQACLLFIELLARANLQATFFIVGRDIELESCRRFCIRAAESGHRLANHTYSHPLNLVHLSYGEKEREIRAAHEALLEVSEYPPIGFRAPAYFLDDQLPEILVANGYAYDSSVLPGIATLFLRLYGRVKNPDGATTFGRVRYAWTSTRPHFLSPSNTGGLGLWELPISVMPVARLPIHMTFVYLLGARFVRSALSLLSRMAGPHVYLFHAADLLDLPQDLSALGAHYPALRVPLQRRIELIANILKQIKTHFRSTTTEDYIRTARYFRE